MTAREVCPAEDFIERKSQLPPKESGFLLTNSNLNSRFVHEKAQAHTFVDFSELYILDGMPIVPPSRLLTEWLESMKLLC